MSKAVAVAEDPIALVDANTDAAFAKGFDVVGAGAKLEEDPPFEVENKLGAELVEENLIVFLATSNRPGWIVVAGVPENGDNCGTEVRKGLAPELPADVDVGSPEVGLK